MKLRQLRAALAVDASGQVALAAQRLNISQPAVSRAIQSLERDLGVILFHRGRAGSQATPVGKGFLTRVTRAMQHLQSAERESRVKTSARQGNSLAAHYLSRHASDHEIRVAIEVGNIQSITAAARVLGVSQPAANRSLKNLENRMGLSLFTRTTQGMEPTQAGKAVIRRMKLAHVELRQAVEELASLREGARGQIRIGVLPLARTLLAPLAVSRLLDQYETAEVMLMDGSYLTLLHALRHGDIDFIVGTIRQPAPTPDIVSESLFEDDLVLVARNDHPVHRLKRLTMEHLIGEKWVLPSKGVPLRANFETILSHMGYGLPQRVIETDSLAVVRSLLLEEDRVAVVSRYQIYHEEKFRLLKIIKLPLESSRRLVGVTTRDDYNPTPLAGELIDHLRQVANEISRRMQALPN